MTLASLYCILVFSFSAWSFSCGSVLGNLLSLLSTLLLGEHQSYLTIIIIDIETPWPVSPSCFSFLSARPVCPTARFFWMFHRYLKLNTAKAKSLAFMSNLLFFCVSLFKNLSMIWDHLYLNRYNGIKYISKVHVVPLLTILTISPLNFDLNLPLFTSTLPKVFQWVLLLLDPSTPSSILP